MSGRGIWALFFILVIAGVVGYLFLKTSSLSLPEVRVPQTKESSSLVAEVKKAVDFLYSFPVSVFSKLSDALIGQPRRLLDEAISLTKQAMEAEQRKVSLEYRAEVLRHYLDEIKRAPRRAMNTETFDKWFSDFLEQLTENSSSQGLLSRERPRERPDRTIRKLLSKNRRDLIRARRMLAKTSSRAKRDIRLACLCSFCSMLFTVFVCGFLVAAICLCRRYFIRDKSHLTAIKPETDASKASLSLKKAPPDPEVLSKAKRQGFFSEALAEVLGILCAYRRWPASVDSAGHGRAEGGLYRHSISVMERMLDSAPAGMDKREVAICGLSHDLGKILTYKEIDGKWVKTGMYHDVLSGAILRALSTNGFSKEAASRILLVVSHHHRPFDLPLNVPEGTRELLELLTRCDAEVARAEKESKGPQASV